MRISDWSSDVCSSDLVMPDRLRWLDWHARQLVLNELLRPASRTFQAAATLAQIEAKGEIDALVAGAEFAEAAAARLFERHLIQYFAAALMMPYGRFLRACDATGYDQIGRASCRDRGCRYV